MAYKMFESFWLCLSQEDKGPNGIQKKRISKWQQSMAKVCLFSLPAKTVTCNQAVCQYSVNKNYQTQKQISSYTFLCHHKSLTDYSLSHHLVVDVFNSTVFTSYACICEVSIFLHVRFSHDYIYWLQICSVLQCCLSKWSNQYRCFLNLAYSLLYNSYS